MKSHANLLQGRFCATGCNVKSAAIGFSYDSGTVFLFSLSFRGISMKDFMFIDRVFELFPVVVILADY
ncbi:hypothetical protein PsorP6_011023 [Peronosclerospora sorghi]|uniref:Uncharacterized protein n=1 Tax=Peronosclerospora sorghi TaxID=230839 RepID=A0ACC0VZY0_9STRA|nr:hypothetical protein PsorP6_011023 [Peronosclerospora sorghi]